MSNPSESVEIEPGVAPAPRWRPIAALDRRVLGVLGEKAKTTPDAYPMTLNAIKSGANQKNNRYPLMDVEIEDVEEALVRLREAGAVAEIQGGGRVAKYRHLLYEWLGVSKVEMAVMVELLLRGAQTEGELRGRAARMEPIADLGALRPVLASLKAKRLIISLSPEGRGHALTHALYEERELEKVRREYQPARPAEDEATEPAGGAAGHSMTHASHARAPLASAGAASAGPHILPGAAGSAAPSAADDAIVRVAATVESLQRAMTQVQAELTKMRKDLDDLWSQFR